MKRFLVLFLLVTSLGMGGISAQKQEIQVTGKVMDKTSNAPIEFATIVIGDPSTNKPISGTTTNDQGFFAIETKAKRFYVEVSFMGFKSKRIDNFSILKGKVALGTIVLEEDAAQLDEVVVAGEKSQTVFKLDKRVFNVGKDLSSTGASALEVLNNVPSVTVNIEGQISLRGSTGVQVLINGKPSVLTDSGGNALGTITADMIERIEVITNPGAKYEAEGTSGILNVVLKKNEKKGLNGSITANVGTPTNNSIGLSVNKRTEKFNLFSQIGYGKRVMPRDNIFESNDLTNNRRIYSKGDREKHEQFFNLRLGTDYHINKTNVITLAGNFAYEIEDEFGDTRFVDYTADALTSSENRNEVTEATNPKWEYEFQYKKDFESHEDHDLLFSATGNFFGKDQESLFKNTNLTDGVLNDQQQTENEFQEARYTFKLDYTYPFADKYTLELGSQYLLNDISNDYAVQNWVAGDWVTDPNLTNVFDYQQNVFGAYGTFGWEGHKLGIKGGLRIEHTELTTELENTNETNKQNYTDLFPSMHISYKLTEGFSLQTGYSRRIFRPRMWNLNPFFNIRNQFSIRTGNPELLPEYSNSYEITAIFNIGKASFNSSVYHRYTTDVSERINTFEDGINYSKPVNAGTNSSLGIEFNFKYNPARWLGFHGDFNWNSFNRRGQYEAIVLDTDGNQWNARMTSKIKFPAGFDFEISGNHRSSFKTIQGTQEANTFVDLGLRKKLWKGKLVANLGIRDIFASRVREFNTIQPSFTTYSKSQSGRFVTFGLSYAFGKGEAMEYSSRKRF
ncbi:MAG: TonB-dependent receptor [Flavobacteriaceae bacterium]|nr:TonB-dependent receptor [Flavobacteriaceae bacterium]